MFRLKRGTEEQDETGYSIHCTAVDKDRNVSMGGYGLYCSNGGKFVKVDYFSGIFDQITSYHKYDR